MSNCPPEGNSHEAGLASCALSLQEELLTPLPRTSSWSAVFRRRLAQQPVRQPWKAAGTRGVTGGMKKGQKGDRNCASCPLFIPCLTLLTAPPLTSPPHGAAQSVGPCSHRASGRGDAGAPVHPWTDEAKPLPQPLGHLYESKCPVLCTGSLLNNSWFPCFFSKSF